MSGDVGAQLLQLHANDAALAEAEVELAHELGRGRRKAEGGDVKTLDVRKRAQAARQKRENLRAHARLKQQLGHEARLLRENQAAAVIQAGYRGRRTRIHGVKRRVVVIGATGQIGMAVCRHCLRRGFEVVGMCRDPTKQQAQMLRRAGIRLYAGDLDDEHSVDRVMAFAVHGSQHQQHTEAYSHLVQRGNIHGMFIVTPYWHDNGDRAGMVAGATIELQRAKNCIDAARRARVAHVILNSACVGGDEAEVGPRSDEYAQQRCCADARRRTPVPGHIRSKAAVEQYMEETLGAYPYAKIGMRQVGSLLASAFHAAS